MLKEVEKAAVVITNPTEFAIALQYGMEMEAPVLVAKGRNLLAAQIKEIARWHGIPIVENPPWRMPCIAPWKSDRPFLPNFMPWWRKFWRPSGERRRALDKLPRGGCNRWPRPHPR
jgi:FlhB HrpN YscU SpaS Family